MIIAIFMTQAEMTLGPDALDIVPPHFLTSDTATYLKARDEYLVSLWATIVVVCMPKLCTQKELLKYLLLCFRDGSNSCAKLQVAILGAWHLVVVIWETEN